MATNCIVLGEDTNKKKIPIHFIKMIKATGEVDTCSASPKEFSNIELIAMNFSYANHPDLMFAYNKNRSAGILYLGKWNDGVVEGE